MEISQDFSNSLDLVREAISNEIRSHAVMKEPKRELFNQHIPQVKVGVEQAEGANSGTKICIYRYNNRRDKFTHEQLKDYIRWFTKMGSVSAIFA